MHAIDMSNNRANIAYIGKTPWHGLGTSLHPGTPLEVWLQASGLGFDYSLAPVAFLDSHVFPEKQVIFRSDTREPLSVVSNRYQVVQPREVLEFFRDLTDLHGFEIETAGSLKGGAVVWALAQTGRELTFGQDRTSQYVLLMTSCDGSLATRATLTSVRVVCWNTLTLALNNGAAHLVVTRHSTRFDASAVKRNLGLVDDAWAAFGDRAREMTKVKLGDLSAREAVIEIFGDPDKPVDEQPNQRAMAQVIQMFEGHGRGSRLPSAEGTAWGLLNAVTEYVDHHAPERKPGSRLYAAWAGRGETLKRRAFETMERIAA